MCSSHYIQIKILNQIVLQDIRSKIGLVEADENKARKAFLSRSEKLAADTLAADRKRETQVKRRLAELERLISTVYEDKVLGKIPEEVCINLLSKYQEERKNLTVELSEIERRLKGDEGVFGVDRAVAAVSLYKNLFHSGIFSFFLRRPSRLLMRPTR